MEPSDKKLQIRAASKIYQYIAAVTANLGIVCSEMHYGWPSPYVPVLQNGGYRFRIGGEEGSWLAVIPLIGAVFGAFFTGLIVDAVGRKRLVIFSSLPFVASWLLVGLAPSSALMFVGRFMAGAADGLSFTAVPMYLGEIAEPKIRGLLASFCPVCIVFGILLINILGAFLPLDQAAFVGVCIPVVLFLTFVWMPESPYFYLMKGNTDEARKSLRRFRGVDDVEEELGRIHSAVKEQNLRKGKFMDLFRVRSNRKALLLSLGLRGCQQLSGTTAFIFYCKTIFEEADGFIPAQYGSIVYFSVQLVLSAVASLIVDFSGRRPLLIVSISGTALTLFANGAYLYVKNCTDVNVSQFRFVPVVALICFVIVFSIGMQVIPLVFMGEIFPTNVKGFALCLMDIFYSITVTIISKFFHWSNDTYGMHVPFFTFACCCVLGLVFIYFCIPETKGRTLEDIQLELREEQRILNNKCVIK